MQEPVRIETDVVIVGGGVAGCLAAVAAAERGLRVVICEKGQLIERCGSVGGGVDHFLTIMETGPEWDTPEFLVRHLPELTDGIVDLEVADRVIRELPKMLRKLESLGVDFRDPVTGSYYRHRAFGLPGTYHLNFDGSKFKHYIGRAARRGKTTVLPRTMVTQLLVSENEAFGVAGFNFRTGEWYLVRAKSVILTTGDVNRLSRNASGLAFDSWHCPYNTGDGHALGYNAGAALVNMEFVEPTLTPKGFSTQGLNALCGLGGHFVNRHGERFMFKYDPRGEKARRAVLTDAVINEILLGNGPVHLDLRHLPEEELGRIEGTLQIDRHTLPAFYRQKGLDFRNDLIEISVSELTIRRSGVYWRGSGLVVDTKGETSISGLFAAGDCASVSGGISNAAALGYIAGQGAADRALAFIGSLPDVQLAVLDEMYSSLFRPLERQKGVAPRAFEDRVRQTVTDYVGFRRTEASLTRGLDRLHRLEAVESQLKAADLHDLSRAHEARHIRLSAQIMARAALERKESRTGSAHRRLDYPQSDPEHWTRFIVVERATGGMAVRTVPTSQSLSGAVQRGRQEQLTA